MTPTRIAILVTVGLLALVAWERTRAASVEACLARGGVWSGWSSRCTTPPPTILRRDIERTGPSQQLLIQAA